MKISLKSSLRLLLAVVLAGIVVTAALRQNAIARLRVENQALSNESAEAQQLARENGEISRLRQENQEVENLRGENAALPRLRNEVRQLRRQADELANLRAENHRLLAQQKTDAGQGGPLKALEGFIGKSSLSNAGFGSPEATVQTFFWAMSQADLQRMGECVTKAPQQEFHAETAENIRRSLRDKMDEFPGFWVTGKKIISAYEVVFGIRLPHDANPSSSQLMHLKLVEGEWKIETNAEGSAFGN